MDTTGRDPLRGKFTRFLQETIKNFKTDYFRKIDHRPVSLDALWQSRTDHFSEKTAAQGFDFQWDALAEAYQSLPRTYQEVLFLLLVREFSPREVADLLHCPVEQVYVRKSRAVKLLRKRLGGVENFVKCWKRPCGEIRLPWSRFSSCTSR